MKIPFFKYHGCGNDFIFVDAIQDKNLYTEKKDQVAFVKKICTRRMGVGADGLAFLLPASDSKNTFRWDFYNKMVRRQKCAETRPLRSPTFLFAP